MNKDQEYLERYTGELEGLLLRLAQEEGLLAGKQFLETEDLTELYLDVVKPLPRGCCTGLRAVSAGIAGVDCLRGNGSGGAVGCRLGAL